MDFIQTSNKQVDKFGAGKHGFKLGNPGGGEQATYLDPEWCDNVQQEIVNVIEGAGAAINPAAKNQMYTAIQTLIANAIATSQNQDFKASVRFTTTGNIALTGLGTQAGGDWPGALTAGDRILAKNQTTGSEVGIYTSAAGAWTRASDADGAGELTSGMVVAVEEGTILADSEWMLTTDGPITIGTTAITFARKDAGAATFKQIQPITAGVSANALTLTLNPTSLDFRANSLTSGTVNTRSVAAAVSVVVPSTATLGTTSNEASRLVVLAIDSTGTVELAVVNLSGGNNLDETTLISTTAISAGANSSNVIYSTTGRANVPFRVVGFVDSTQAVAGTWSAQPNKIQGAGGQAIGALASIGYGQTWQDVTGTRAAGTTYKNDRNRPIQMSVVINSTGSAQGSITVCGVVVVSVIVGAVGATHQYTFTIPPGGAYLVTLSAGSIHKWSELR